jgi:serine/alanine adding enzyme
MSKIEQNSADIEIVRCGENEKNAWDAFVENAPNGTVSHLYGWRRIISAAYGHKSFYLMARKGESVVGILPLIWVKSRLFGNTLASMPFQDYGGILSNDPGAIRLLFEHALQLKNECDSDCLELRYRDPFLESDGFLREDKVTLVLDISMGHEELWKSLSGKVRNQVRKAEKSGLTTHLGGAELLEEFYPVFAANMRDLGSPVHNSQFFAQIFLEFGEKARLLLVRHENRTIGGLIVLLYGDVAIVPWASSLREHFSKCPNNLLYRDVMQFVCERGCKTFDFGRSSIGSGTYSFKVQWGAKPIPLHWQLFFKKGQRERASLSDDPKFQMAAKIWSRLPLALTVQLGPTFRKYLVN